MRYADITDEPKLNFTSLLGASSTTVLSIAALVAIMAPPIATMMMAG